MIERKFPPYNEGWPAWPKVTVAHRAGHQFQTWVPARVVRRAQGGSASRTPSWENLPDVGAYTLWVSLFSMSCGQCLFDLEWVLRHGLRHARAIGAHSAYSDRRVPSIRGDTGFLMNLQELETTVRLKINVVAMVSVHGEYGSIKWKQQTHFQGRHSALKFDNPDVVKLAESFGLWGRELGSPGENVPVLEQAFTQDGPALTAVPVDHSENMKRTVRLGKVSMRI